MKRLIAILSFALLFTTGSYAQILSSSDPAADLNGDGTVDIADFVSVLNIMAGQ